jgi:hypothetical protein
LHAFLFSRTDTVENTNSERKAFSEGVQNDLDSMQAFCADVARSMNFKYQEHSLAGVHFNSVEIERTLSSANSIVHQGDVVILYFATHGFKTRNDTDVFPEVDIYGKYISSYSVYKQLSRLNPRTLLVLVDACSNYWDAKSGDLISVQGNFEPSDDGSNVDIKNVKNLIYLSLFNYCRQIIICAAEPGIETYALKTGSICTTGFLKAFKKEVQQNGNAAAYSWDNIFENTKAYSIQASANLPNIVSPLCEIRSCSLGLADTPALQQLAKSKIGELISEPTWGIDAHCWRSDKNFIFGKNKYTVHFHVVNGEFFLSDSIHGSKRIIGGKPIDSVRYYVDNKTITLHKNDLVTVLYPDEPIFGGKIFEQPVKRNSNFNYRAIVDSSGNYKVKIFYANGSVLEEEGRYVLPKDDWWDKKLPIFISLTAAAIAALGLFIVKRKHRLRH